MLRPQVVLLLFLPFCFGLITPAPGEPPSAELPMKLATQDLSDSDELIAKPAPDIKPHRGGRPFAFNGPIMIPQETSISSRSGNQHPRARAIRWP